MDSKQVSASPVHLVVLQHGLWGSAQNLEYVESLLQQQVSALEDARSLPVRMLNSTVNTEKLTYDGVDTCGMRLVQLIKDTAEALKAEGLQATQISFIGYSLGGLIARYAVGALHHEGAFTTASSSSLCLEPVNFVTIATPHLGAWRFMEQASWLSRLYNSMFHGMVPVIASMTGHQLMLKDAHAWGRPLLMLMSDPALPFYQGLRRFKKLLLLANTHHDRMVPYRTAAICHVDPYHGRHTTPAHDPVKYPSVVRHCDDQEEAQQRALAGRWFIFVFFSLLPLLLPIMLVVLAKMSWEGRQHYAKLIRQGFSHTWLLNAASGSVEARGAAMLDVEQGSESGSIDEGTGCAEAQSILLEEKDGEPVLHSPVTTCTTLEKQQWMIESLNQLPWSKVDVDVRHGHAHAAIVLRNNRFTEDSHLRFLFSRMQW